MSDKTRVAISGASFLALSSMLAKILAAFYRIPYQNYVGDIGFYVYQQVYPIYGLAMTLGISGFPLFVSKMVAESHHKEDEQVVLHRLFIQISVICVGLFAFFFGFQNQLAYFMGEERLAPLIAITSFTFLIVPFTSILRGGFQGHLIMQPTGISQVVEQFVRVSIIWFAAFQFVKFGKNVYETGELALSGSLFGGIFSMMILMIAYRGNKNFPRIFKRNQQVEKRNLSSKVLLKRLILEGGGLSVYAGLLIFYQFVDSFAVKNGLERYGFSELVAQTQKGIYDRAQPIVQLGLVVALAFTTSFLPFLAKSYIQKNEAKFDAGKRIYLKISFALSSAITVGLILLLPYFNYILFSDNAMEEALECFLLTIFFMAMSQTIQSIYQSKEEVYYPIFVALLSIVVKIIATYPLTSLMGAMGASMSTVLASMVVFCLLAWKCAFDLPKMFYVKVMISLLMMSVPLILLRIFENHFGSRIILLAIVLCVIAFCGILFIGMNLLFNTFTKEEERELPLIKKFRKKDGV